MPWCSRRAPTTTQSAFKVGFLAGVALPVDGGAVDLAIANPGEGARLNIAGVAGQNLGLGITGLVLSPTSATSASIAVYKPDAGLLASINCRVDGTQCAANLTNLPVTGTYSIIVQPASGATGSLQAWLSRDAAGTLASGTPLRLTLARPGQNARLTFAGAAGALIALQVRDVATNPAAQGLFITISKPDGSSLTYSHLTGAGQILVAPPLPVTGTYTVFLEPESAAKGAATASMEVLLDPGQSLAIDGPTSDAAIALRRRQRTLHVCRNGRPEPGPRRQQSGVESEGRCDGIRLRTGRGAAHRLRVRCGGRRMRRQSQPCRAAAPTGSWCVRPRARRAGSASRCHRTSAERWSPAAPRCRFPSIGPAAMRASPSPARRARRFASPGPPPRSPGRPARRPRTSITPGGATLGTAWIVNGAAGSYDIPALPATGNYTVFIDPAAGATLNATLTLVAR